MIQKFLYKYLVNNNDIPCSCSHSAWCPGRTAPLWYATVSCTITVDALSKMEAQHIAVSRKINLAFFQYCTTPLQPEVIRRKTF